MIVKEHIALEIQVLANHSNQELAINVIHFGNLFRAKNKVHGTPKFRLAVPCAAVPL
jgi:hypothetical protein